MRKTPTGDDEHDKYSQKMPSRRPQLPAQQSYVQRRNNRVEASSVDTYSDSDEYFNVPKIRRASRFVVEEERLPVVTDELLSVDDAEEERAKVEGRISTRRERTGRREPSPQPRPYAYKPPSKPHSSPVQAQRVQRPARPMNNDRLQQQGTPARRPYEQYARYGRHEKRRHPRTLLSVLQDFSHNRTRVTMTVVALLALIFVPILINTTLNAMRTSTTSGMISGTGQSSSSESSQSIGQQPTDTHAIIITPPETDHPAPPVLATSAYLLDANTGATLYAYNPFMHLPMMSTTKLMTATLAIERGNLDQKVTITDAIASDLSTLSADSSVMGIKKGETYTLRELMYGLMLVSGNDAAVAIGDTIAGNLPSFVAMMNEKARSLGLLDTHYMNPHGLLARGHYSSAHDLAVMGRYAASLPELAAIDGTRTYDVAKTGSHPAHHLINGNQFLWWYPGVNGGKPGWDGGANFVQVISCIRNGHHLIGVVMHTNNWWTDMRDLMNWGFNTFTWISPHDVDLHQQIPYDNQWYYFAQDKKDVTIPTADQGRYYVYTGYSVTGLILGHFDRNGGLKKFGYPTGLVVASGGSTVSQKFEHSTIQCDTVSKQCTVV
ncbi:MAG: hypothetical protein NVS4B12_03270 [Ktedonobacteraceae bacterium]